MTKSPLFLGFLFLDWPLPIFILFRGNHHVLELLLLSDPKEVLVEVFELLKDSPLPKVSLVILGHFDDLVDHPHYEVSVVLILPRPLSIIKVGLLHIDLVTLDQRLLNNLFYPVLLGRARTT